MRALSTARQTAQVDLLKMLNYLKLGDSQGFFLTELAFVANLVSWIYFRLYLYPVKVTHSPASILRTPRKWHTCAHTPVRTQRFCRSSTLPDGAEGLSRRRRRRRR